MTEVEDCRCLTLTSKVRAVKHYFSVFVGTVSVHGMPFRSCMCVTGANVTYVIEVGESRGSVPAPARDGECSQRKPRVHKHFVTFFAELSSYS